MIRFTSKDINLNSIDAIEAGLLLKLNNNRRKLRQSNKVNTSRLSLFNG